jgi:predicted ATPase/class 3 adenylate cyclase
MVDLPTGTVTFLFTDVEGSTRLWEEHATAMRAAAARHDAIVEGVVADHGGVLVRPRGEGDSRFAVFARASDAVAAASALQRALTAENWPTLQPLRVRMALHTGEADLREGDYYGAAVNRCARLRATAHGGQVLLSQTTRDLTQLMLPEGTSLDDLGEHRLPDLAAPEHVYQLGSAASIGDFPPLKSLDTLPHNLPLQLTSFVGREREMGEVKQLLATTHLLTLTGTGGCGKTRLALQVAAELLAAYPQGVWLVELAPLADPGLVPDVVAGALGVRAGPAQPIQVTLLSYLRTRQLLVLLDNCEHLLDACARWVDSILRSCPGVRILATSREALGIAGEVSWRVPSLTLPSTDPGRPATETDGEAIRLFVERARAVQPGFTLTERNAPVVAQLCQRLDGIPLAIELAATRVRALPLEQIAARLGQRFRLLTGGSRTALPRQQTLAATVSWSYDLLAEPERQLFNRLSVFAGGFTLEAAEAVCSEGRPPFSPSPQSLAPSPQEDVSDVLSNLVGKSLVVADGGVGGVERYRLFETLRQYGREKLVAAGEAAEVHQRHATYYLQLAEELAPQIYDRRQLVALAHLDPEIGNARAALRWLLDETDSAAGLRLLSALFHHWYFRGLLIELAGWLEAFLDLPHLGEPTSDVARALSRLGMFCWWRGDTARGRAYLEQARAMARAIGDRAVEADGLVTLGDLTSGLAGRTLLEEGVRLARLADDDQTTTEALLHLARLEFVLGDPAQARRDVDEALARAHRRGDRRQIAFALEIRGEADSANRPIAARSDLEEGLRLYHELGDQSGMISVETFLGRLDSLHGRFLAARDHYRTCLRIAKDWLWLQRIAQLLDGLAIVAAGRGRAERAIRLTSFEQRDDLPRYASVSEPVELERALAPIRQALGDKRVDALQAEGRAMTLEQVIDYALAEEA